MCARFTLRTPMSVLVDQFRLEQAPQQLELRYNVAPTQPVAAVRVKDEQRRCLLFRWGLVPSWAKDLSIGSRLINARSETVAEKPSFRFAFRHRRCLVLTDGYFEWRKEGKIKQPYYFRMADERPFAFAGLWDRWRGGEEPLESCTVLTTEPNELTRGIHNRMPVILEESDYDLWLDPDVEDKAPLLKLLRSYDSSAMKSEPVSTRVNNVRNDDPECVAVQRGLFD